MQGQQNYRSKDVISRDRPFSDSNGELFSESEWSELINKLDLSPRQAEVIQRILSGFSDKQIALDLRIAVPTVRTHLNRVFLRLGVQDRTEVVLHVFRQFRESFGTNGCHLL
jgi:DNA-binding NarL/FixJ family response regulator